MVNTVINRYNQGMRNGLFLLIITIILAGCGFKSTSSVPGGSIPLSINQAENMDLKDKKVQQAVVAGQFYPSDADELKQMIDKYLQTPVAIKLAPPRAIIVPHAGYQYSGQTAAYAFKQIQGWGYKRVIVMAPSHYEHFVGASILDVDYYQTPLGLIKISPVVKELLSYDIFSIVPSAHDREHSLEVELPFLQVVLADFELIPIIVSASNSFDQVQAITEAIKPFLDDETLLVISTDFTHYGPNYGYLPFTDNQAVGIKKIDDKAFGFIKQLAAAKFYNYVKDSQVTIDGGTVIPIVLSALSATEVKQLQYDTSGRQLNDYTNSVSYAAFAFYDKTALDLDDKQKSYLLKLARQSVEAAVNGQPLPQPDESSIDVRFLIKQGVFVGLEKQGNLRGSIGYLSPYKPIYQAVIDNAKSAALNDQRFSPVAPAELKDIKVGVSILSVPTLLTKDNYQQKLDQLRPGIDGLVLQQGNQQATYLPTVWQDLTDKLSFLNNLSKKAGWPSNAWQDANTLWYTYQALHLGE